MTLTPREQSPPTAKKFGGSAERTFSTSEIVLSEIRFPATSICRRHSHAGAFLSLLLAGGYTERFGMTTLRHRQHSLVFHPPDTVHGDRITLPQTKLFTCELSDALIERMQAEGAAPPRIPLACSAHANWLATRLYQHFDAGPVSALLVEGLVLELLWFCGTRKQDAGAREAWLHAAINILQAEFCTEISICSLGARLNVNPARLSRHFRRKYGQSISGYVAMLRGSKAAKALAESECSLSEIALACGFADQSHFTRVFKQMSGLTPGNFRLTSRRAGKNGARPAIHDTRLQSFSRFT